MAYFNGGTLKFSPSDFLFFCFTWNSTEQNKKPAPKNVSRETHFDAGPDNEIVSRETSPVRSFLFSDAEPTEDHPQQIIRQNLTGNFTDFIAGQP